eukprot:4118688-Prymnesium_polylepis.1
MVSQNASSHPPLLDINGVCPTRAQLFGTYMFRGLTAIGAPYYTKQDAPNTIYSLYYDTDCSGRGANARWIMDRNLPNPALSSDLDEDGGCWSNSGQLQTTDLALPLGTHGWRFVCGGWRNLDITLTELLVPLPPPEMAPSPPPP